MKIVILASLILSTLVSATSARAQIINPYPPLTKQLAAPLPKVALLGAVAATKGKIPYHKIILTVTNREKYSIQMFKRTDGVELPPNPCSGSRSRIVAAVYSDLGRQYAKCLTVPGKDSLSELSFLIEKGKPIPNYVYLVLSDLQTGAAYRSNLVSPSTGATK